MKAGADGLGLGKRLIAAEMNNYRVLDIAKYVAAILVICIHCSAILPQEFVNFLIQNIICRVAVPFFFMASAYFIRKSVCKNPQYIGVYLKKTAISYGLWSLAFVPIGVDWMHQNLAMADGLLPFAALYGLIHVGTYYHLWYVPALIFSVFAVHMLLKRVSYRMLFILAGILFLFGSLETYYGLLPAGGFKDVFDLLMSVIFTTRSGLLYGVLFVVMGFFIFDYQEKLRGLLRLVPLGTLVSAVLLVVEGCLLYRIPRLDMNFLLMLLPFSFFLFLWLLSFPYRPKKETKKLREWSKYYYFVHPVCIVIMEQIGVSFGLTWLSSGVLSLLLILALTHLLSVLIVRMKKPIALRRILLSAIGGLILAFVCASVFFLFKKADLVIKFEFVPCLWFVSSFICAYWLCKRRKTSSAPQRAK